MTAGGRCSFLRAACCERIVKWRKLTIKEGDQGNERKTKVICKHRLSGVTSVSGWVRRESWDERNEKGRGGEKRKLFPQSPCEPAGLRDGIKIFWTGGGGVGRWGKIFTFKHCFICSSCCKQFFGVSVFLQTHLFVLIYNLFQCFQPLQTINFKIFQLPPPPRQKNYGPSLRVYPGCRGLF